VNNDKQAYMTAAVNPSFDLKLAENNCYRCNLR